MKVTDSHFHLFDTARFPYSWLSETGMDTIPRPFTITDYLAEVSGSGIEVEAAVHVDAEQDRSIDQVQVTRQLQALHDERPRGSRHELRGGSHGHPVAADTGRPVAADTGRGLPTAAVIWADLAADSLADDLDRHLESTIVRGVRQHVFHPPAGEYYPTQAARAGLMSDTRWRRGYARLPDFDLSFDLFIWPNQLDEAIELVSTFPDVEVIYEHALMPAVWPSFGAWRTAVDQLPVRDNTFMKLSAFGQMGNLSIDSVKPYVDVALENFGPERCMYASNFPVDAMGSSWTNLWQTYALAADGLTSQEKDQVFRTTARRAYRL